MQLSQGDSYSLLRPGISGGLAPPFLQDLKGPPRPKVLRGAAAEAASLRPLTAFHEAARSTLDLDLHTRQSFMPVPVRRHATFDAHFMQSWRAMTIGLRTIDRIPHASLAGEILPTALVYPLAHDAEDLETVNGSLLLQGNRADTSTTHIPGPGPHCRVGCTREVVTATVTGAIGERLEIRCLTRADIALAYLSAQRDPGSDSEESDQDDERDDRSASGRNASTSSSMRSSSGSDADTASSSDSDSDSDSDLESAERRRPALSHLLGPFGPLLSSSRLFECEPGQGHPILQVAFLQGEATQSFLFAPHDRHRALLVRTAGSVWVVHGARRRPRYFRRDPRGHPWDWRVVAVADFPQRTADAAWNPAVPGEILVACEDGACHLLDASDVLTAAGLWASRRKDVPLYELAREHVYTHAPAARDFHAPNPLAAPEMTDDPLGCFPPSNHPAAPAVGAAARGDASSSASSFGGSDSDSDSDAERRRSGSPSADRMQGIEDEGAADLQRLPPRHTLRHKLVVGWGLAPREAVLGYGNEITRVRLFDRLSEGGNADGPATASVESFARLGSKDTVLGCAFLRDADPAECLESAAPGCSTLFVVLGVHRLALYDLARPGRPLLEWLHRVPRVPYDGHSNPLRSIPGHLQGGARARMAVTLALHPDSLAALADPSSAPSAPLVFLAAVSDHISGEVIGFPFQIEAPKKALVARPPPPAASPYDPEPNLMASQDLFLATLSQNEDLAGLSQLSQQLSQGGSQRRRLAGTQGTQGHVAGGAAPLGAIDTVSAAALPLGASQPLPPPLAAGGGGAGPSSPPSSPGQGPAAGDAFVFQPRFLTLQVSALGVGGVQLVPSLLSPDPWDSIPVTSAARNGQDVDGAVLQGEFLGGALPALMSKERRLLINPSYREQRRADFHSVVTAKIAADELKDTIPLLQGLACRPVLLLDARQAPDPDPAGETRGRTPNPSSPGRNDIRSDAATTPALAVALTVRSVWNGHLALDILRGGAQHLRPPEGLGSAHEGLLRAEDVRAFLRLGRGAEPAATITPAAATPAATARRRRAGEPSRRAVRNLPRLFAFAAQRLVGRLPGDAAPAQRAYIEALGARVAEEARRLGERADVQKALEAIRATLLDPADFRAAVTASDLGLDLWALTDGAFWELEEEEGAYQTVRRGLYGGLVLGGAVDESSVGLLTALRHELRRQALGSIDPTALRAAIDHAAAAREGEAPKAGIVRFFEACAGVLADGNRMPFGLLPYAALALHEAAIAAKASMARFHAAPRAEMGEPEGVFLRLQHLRPTSEGPAAAPTELTATIAGDASMLAASRALVVGDVVAVVPLEVPRTVIGELRQAVGAAAAGPPRLEPRVHIDNQTWADLGAAGGDLEAAAAAMSTLRGARAARRSRSATAEEADGGEGVPDGAMSVLEGLRRLEALWHAREELGAAGNFKVRPAGEEDESALAFEGFFDPRGEGPLAKGPGVRDDAAAVPLRAAAAVPMQLQLPPQRPTGPKPAYVVATTAAASGQLSSGPAVGSQQAAKPAAPARRAPRTDGF